MHGLEVTHAATWTNHLTSGLTRSMSLPFERKEIKDGCSDPVWKWSSVFSPQLMDFNLTPQITFGITGKVSWGDRHSKGLRRENKATSF